MSAGCRLHSERGYSLTELLLASAIMMVVTGAIFGLVNPSQGSAQAQPEIADMQQRMRIGSDILFKELLMAGAGPYQGPVTGSLVNFFAPIVPRRLGLTTDDGSRVARDDRLTLSYVPNTYSQTSIALSMPPQSTEIKVNYPPNCPQKRTLCGFDPGMVVILFDSSGNFDTFTLTHVQNDAGHLQHRGQVLNYTYPAGATITQIASYTYYRNPDTNQLMRYDGGWNDVPLVDNVVDLRFEYFGDVNPPLMPKPPPGTSNCLYDASGNHNAGLPVLTANEGSLAALPVSMLADGPWCGSGSNMFDADLLRVRKVRVTMRVQVGPEALRGSSALLFANPGTQTRSASVVPDYLVRFDVTPRNLNLAR